jgi:hypothetical protein
MRSAAAAGPPTRMIPLDLAINAIVAGLLLGGFYAAVTIGYAMSWIASVAVAAALKRRAVEGGSYRIRISLARLSLWLLHMGIFDKAYATSVAGRPGEHEYRA